MLLFFRVFSIIDLTAFLCQFLEIVSAFFAFPFLCYARKMFLKMEKKENETILNYFLTRVIIAVFFFFKINELTKFGFRDVFVRCTTGCKPMSVMNVQCTKLF